MGLATGLQRYTSFHKREYASWLVWHDIWCWTHQHWPFLLTSRDVTEAKDNMICKQVTTRDNRYITQIMCFDKASISRQVNIEGVEELGKTYKTHSHWSFRITRTIIHWSPEDSMAEHHCWLAVESFLSSMEDSRWLVISVFVSPNQST